MDKEKADKIKKLKLLVIATAILILAAWIFNLKNQLRLANETIDQNASQDAQEMKDEMKKIVDEIGNRFEEVKETEVNEPGPIVEYDVPAPSSIACPEYINCMPTIGEARPCTIPPGCEDRTIIVY